MKVVLMMVLEAKEFMKVLFMRQVVAGMKRRLGCGGGKDFVGIGRVIDSIQNSNQIADWNAESNASHNVTGGGG